MKPMKKYILLKPSKSQRFAISIHLFSPELVRLTFCTFLLLGFAPTRLAGPAVGRPVARRSDIAACVRVVHVAPCDWLGMRVKHFVEKSLTADENKKLKFK